MERLEERQMMAGDVTAYFNDGVLRIGEASGQTGRDNSVFVRQMGYNTIRVLGNSTADGSISRVNGAAYKDFVISSHTPFDINVDLGSGNDTVQFTDIRGATPDSGISLQHVTINTESRTGTAGTGDRDSVSVSFVETAATMTIVTGADNDLVSVSNSRSYGGLAVGTGAGSDTVEVISSVFGNGVDISTFANLSETDVDHLTMKHILCLEVNAELGGGNDTFLFDDIQLHANYPFTGDFTLDAGAGNDTGSITNLSAVHVKALLGDGSDTLKLDYIRAKESDIEGQGGTDSLSKTSNMWIDKVFESGWETINGRSALLNNLLNVITATSTPSR
jgi:hypothetical protein